MNVGTVSLIYFPQDVVLSFTAKQQGSFQMHQKIEVLGHVLQRDGNTAKDVSVLKLCSICTITLHLSAVCRSETKHTNNVSVSQYLVFPTLAVALCWTAFCQHSFFFFSFLNKKNKHNIITRLALESDDLDTHTLASLQASIQLLPSTQLKHNSTYTMVQTQRGRSSWLFPVTTPQAPALPLHTDSTGRD